MAELIASITWQFSKNGDATEANISGNQTAANVYHGLLLVVG